MSFMMQTREHEFVIGLLPLPVGYKSDWMFLYSKRLILAFNFFLYYYSKGIVTDTGKFTVTEKCVNLFRDWLAKLFKLSD